MTIGAAQQFFLGASKATGGGAAGYQIERSLRFNSSDSGFCARTPGTAGNRRTWTWAGWVKISTLGTTRRIFGVDGASDTDLIDCRFETNDKFIIAANTIQFRTTTQVFRDVSSWYHIVIAFDTTLAVANDRIKLYVNGSQVTAFDTTNNPTQNADTGVNRTAIHRIGAGYVAGNYFNGYLAECYLIDGQQLTPSSFTEVSATTGQLIPKAYTGTFGTNGFWLKFSDNSAATAATLGKDYSGNSNNWTPNNFSVNYPNYSNPVYSSTLTTNDAFFYPKERAFDGDLSTLAYSNNVSATFTWNASSYGFSNCQVEAYFGVGTGGGAVSGTTIQINGSTVQTLPLVFLAPQWHGPFSVSGSFNELKIISGNNARLHAVRVNGIILVDRGVGDPDSLVDTPTSFGTDTGVGGEVRGNYATFNPLNAAHTYTNGNLDLTISTTGHASIGPAVGSIGVSSGKWYFEFTPTSITSNPLIGITAVPATDRYPGYSAFSYGYYAADGNKYNSNSASSYGNSWVANDVIGVAFDLDAGKLWFSKNGTWQASGNPSTGTNAAFTSITAGVYFPAIHKDSNGASTFSGVFNFGQRAFAYTAPSGFKALCDTNLGAPLTAKPNTVMDVLTWTGNGVNGRAITGLNFSPDFVWIKNRTNPSENSLFDTVRGAAKTLYSNQTAAELATSDFGHVSSFDANGFTLANGASSPYPNLATNWNGSGIVGWAWDAGTSTVSNTAGSITSQVRANASAGFSVVSYTSTGGTATVGHGLGVAPSMVITKGRNVVSAFITQHIRLAANNVLFLNGTDASQDVSANGALPTPTSTVFSVNNQTGSNGGTYNMIAYCFAPVVGYSSMGSYVGNGSADGPFVYTGFRPKFILVKNASVGGTGYNWEIYDSVRNTYNVMALTLLPNTADAEITASGGVRIDFTSNGFKWRDSGASINGSGNTMIYAAFAENPFQYARAR